MKLLHRPDDGTNITQLLISASPEKLVEVKRLLKGE